MGSLLEGLRPGCYCCGSPFIDFECIECKEKICSDCIGSEDHVNDFRTNVIIKCKACDQIPFFKYNKFKHYQRTFLVNSLLVTFTPIIFSFPSFESIQVTFWFNIFCTSHIVYIFLPDKKYLIQTINKTKNWIIIICST